MFLAEVSLSRRAATKTGAGRKKALEIAVANSGVVDAFISGGRKSRGSAR
jgi:hypothetical protein